MTKSGKIYNKQNDGSVYSQLIETEMKLIAIQISNQLLELTFKFASFAVFLKIAITLILRTPVETIDAYVFAGAFIIAFTRVHIDRYTHKLLKQHKELSAKNNANGRSTPRHNIRAYETKSKDVESNEK